MAMRSIPAIPRRRVWTVADLEDLPSDSGRHEIIDGELIVTPMPSGGHQDVAAALLRIILSWCIEHTGWTVRAPGGMYISETTWLAPDLTVFTVPQFSGVRWQEMPAPVLVIEILSPSTAVRDRVRKRPLYLPNGVGEVWIVDCEARTIERWTAAADEPTTEQGSSIWHLDPSLPALTIPHDAVFGPITH
jgi:Uma2 family endonuclease